MGVPGRGVHGEHVKPLAYCGWCAGHGWRYCDHCLGGRPCVYCVGKTGKVPCPECRGGAVQPALPDWV